MENSIGKGTKFQTKGATFKLIEKTGSKWWCELVKGSYDGVNRGEMILFSESRIRYQAYARINELAAKRAELEQALQEIDSALESMGSRNVSRVSKKSLEKVG